MTDFLREARTTFQRAEMTDAEAAQTAALIAIAEALQGDLLFAAQRDSWKEQAEDRDLAVEQLEVERDQLREVVKGADHTAAKYYKRMRDAERDRDQAAKRHRAAALRDAADEVIRGTRHNWVATEIAAALRERADQEEGVTDADPT